MAKIALLGEERGGVQWGQPGPLRGFWCGTRCCHGLWRVQMREAWVHEPAPFGEGIGFVVTRAGGGGGVA